MSDRPFKALPFTVPSVLLNPYIWDSAKLFLLGSIVETGRRVFQWAIERFRIRYTVSAQFKMGDPAYLWLVSFLTEENLWSQSGDVIVEAKTSHRKSTLKSYGAENDHVDYIPDYGTMHFFRWKGYWLEIRKSQLIRAYDDDAVGGHSSSIHLKIYTLDMKILFAFVEECRLKYLESSKSRVTIYTKDRKGYGDRETYWNTIKTKTRRPLESLILQEGMIGGLFADAREFLAMEDWYIKAGIPHRRGYLLHGPPGTGKTTTVYAVAGELGLPIYVLSLSSPDIDDGDLARAVSLLPPRGILLIEDIDCAFPSREEEEEMDLETYKNPWAARRSQVTLSGLLNILDGIGSEEGKIFFATTNYIDRLDPALLRPGRIDRKYEYKLASTEQACALFGRFFPVSSFGDTFRLVADTLHIEDQDDLVQRAADDLADKFASAVPEYEFSTAELQGYLLDWKRSPVDAMRCVTQWVEYERQWRRAREMREQLRKAKLEARVRNRVQANYASNADMGNWMDQSQEPPHPPSALSRNHSSTGAPDAYAQVTSSSSSEEGLANVGLGTPSDDEIPYESQKMLGPQA